MGGRGWAHVHPVPAILGHWILADPKFFFGRGGHRGDGGQQICIEKHLTAALQTVCIYLASGGFAPGPRLGTSVPQTPRSPVPTLTSEPGYATVSSSKH